MARVAKHDTKSLLNRERELRGQLKQVRQQRRAAEDAARQERLARVGELADKFNITHIPDTVLAAEFKRIAAEHPAPAATESSADDATDTAEVGEVAQTPTGDATAPASPGTEHAAETAEAEGGERKRWPWK